MSKKWSQKTEKATLHAEDEFLIIDSEDPEYSGTKNKRVKVKNAAPFKKYVALLTQTGTNAPLATVHENTIGNIVWTRVGAGDYVGTLAGAFTLGKTFLLSGNTEIAGSAIVFKRTGADTISLNKGLDNALTNTPIEVRVYPIIAIP